MARRKPRRKASDKDVGIVGLEELNAALKDVSEALRGKFLAEVMLQAGKEILVPAVQEKAPVEYGDLRDSIEVKKAEVKGEHAVVAVVAGAFYAHFVELGVQPHKIKPRKGNRRKALLIDGRWVRKVNHPGVRAKPFMRPAFDENEARVVERARELMEEKVRKAVG